MAKNRKETMTIDFEISGENLKERIRKYDRQSVLYLLKENAMNRIPESDKVSVIQQIVLLRDMHLIDELAKSEEHFTVNMFDIDVNNRLNNDFVSHILDKHSKKFDLSDDQVCDEVFSLARTVGNTKLCGKLMKKTSPSEDAIVDALLHAAFEKDATTQIGALDRAGYDIRTKNSAEQTAADLLRKRIADYTYPSGKKGLQMKRSEQNALLYMEKLLREKESAKKTRRTMIKLVTAAVVVIAALAAGTVWYMNRDTSTVVADGGTINIDYTGYQQI